MAGVLDGDGLWLRGGVSFAIAVWRWRFIVRLEMEGGDFFFRVLILFFGRSVLLNRKRFLHNKHFHLMEFKLEHQLYIARSLLVTWISSSILKYEKLHFNC